MLLSMISLPGMVSVMERYTDSLLTWARLDLPEVFSVMLSTSPVRMELRLTESLSPSTGSGMEELRYACLFRRINKFYILGQNSHFAFIF